jgi:hypothetical protein
VRRGSAALDRFSERRAHFCIAGNGGFPPYQDFGAGRIEWLLMGTGSKIENDRLEGAKLPFAA